MAFFHLSVLSVSIILCVSTKIENTTLLLVQTLSRHGDRSPTIFSPNDPYALNCFPNGLGQLTQLGWEQQFDLGVFFKLLYADFFPLHPKEIYANSSGDSWCLDSAAALLASFSPIEDIPIHHLPLKTNQYLDYTFICKRANEVYFAAVENTKYQLMLKHKARVREMTKLSGVDFTQLGLAGEVFIQINEEIIHNCTVPGWGYKHYDAMQQLYNIYLKIHLNSPEQIRLRIGPFLGLLNSNLKNKVDGKSDLKFILNMAHDLQVNGILTALNFTEFAHAPFCATLFFELHQMADSSMAVRLRYMNTTYPLSHESEQPMVLVLDGCSEFCPLDYFMNSYQWLIPDDWEKECQTNTRNMFESWKTDDIRTLIPGG